MHVLLESLAVAHTLLAIAKWHNATKATQTLSMYIWLSAIHTIICVRLFYNAGPAPLKVVETG